MNAYVTKDMAKDDRIILTVAVFNTADIPLTARKTWCNLIDGVSFTKEHKDDTAWAAFKTDWAGIEA